MNVDEKTPNHDRLISVPTREYIFIVSLIYYSIIVQQLQYLQAQQYLSEVWRFGSP